MNKKERLRQILGVLSPDGTSVDFKEFDDALAKLKEGVKEKVQAQTLTDVNTQLERFRKRLDFKPLEEAMANLETSLDRKIESVTGLMNDEIKSFKELLTNQTEVSDQKINDQVSSVASNIEVLKKELLFLNDQKSVELEGFKKELEKLQAFTKQADKSYVEIQGTIQELKQELREEDAKEIKTLTEKLEKLRKDLMSRISNLGGGAMNRQNFIGNVDPLTRYTDINWKAGSNVTITYANNDQTKRVDITIAATGGGPGGGIVRSVNSVAVDTAAGDTTGTDFVYLVTGTTRITLPTAVGNSNLYTVKNVGTGVVTIATTGGQTIDGNTTITMATQFTSVDLISDTANWGIT